MRKRGKKHGQRGHVMTPQQVEKIMLPLHVAVELLPLGLFRQQHADDLVVVVLAAALAAQEAGNQGVKEAADRGAAALQSMLERVNQGKSWNMTAAERQDITYAVTVIDRWQRTQSTARWRRAFDNVLVMLNWLEADIAKP